MLGTHSILVTLPAAAALAGVAALADGLLALRTSGFVFLMTTLAFGQMLYFLFHDTALGGGADGVFITRPTLGAFGLEWTIGRRDRPAVMLWLNLLVLVAFYGGLAALQGTRSKAKPLAKTETREDIVRCSNRLALAAGRFLPKLGGALTPPPFGGGPLPPISEPSLLKAD